MSGLSGLASSVGRLLGRAARKRPDWEKTAASATKGAVVGGAMGSVAGPTGRAVGSAAGAAVGAAMGALRTSAHATDYEDAITRRIKALEAKATDLEEALERERAQTSDLILDNAKLRAGERLLERRLERRGAWLWFAWFVALAALAALGFYTLGLWLGGNS